MARRPPPPELRKAFVETEHGRRYVQLVGQAVTTWGNGHAERMVFGSSGLALQEYLDLAFGGSTVTRDPRPGGN